MNTAGPLQCALHPPQKSSENCKADPESALQFPPHSITPPRLKSTPPQLRDNLRNGSLVISTFPISVAEVPLTVFKPPPPRIVSGGGLC